MHIENCGTSIWSKGVAAFPFCCESPDRGSHLCYLLHHLLCHASRKDIVSFGSIMIPHSRAPLLSRFVKAS